MCVFMQARTQRAQGVRLTVGGGGCGATDGAADLDVCVRVPGARGVPALGLSAAAACAG